jgi:hypothetical protein
MGNSLLVEVGGLALSAMIRGLLDTDEARRSIKGI